MKQIKPIPMRHDCAPLIEDAGFLYRNVFTIFIYSTSFITFIHSTLYSIFIIIVDSISLTHN